MGKGFSLAVLVQTACVCVCVSEGDFVIAAFGDAGSNKFGETLGNLTKVLAKLPSKSKQISKVNNTYQKYTLLLNTWVKLLGPGPMV